MTYFLKRKNKKRFFSFQSMPNLNFAELIFNQINVSFRESQTNNITNPVLFFNPFSELKHSSDASAVCRRVFSQL